MTFRPLSHYGHALSGPGANHPASFPATQTPNPPICTPLLFSRNRSLYVRAALGAAGSVFNPSPARSRRGQDRASSLSRSGARDGKSAPMGSSSPTSDHDSRRAPPIFGQQAPSPPVMVYRVLRGQATNRHKACSFVLLLVCIVFPHVPLLRPLSLFARDIVPRRRTFNNPPMTSYACTKYPLTHKEAASVCLLHDPAVRIQIPPKCTVSAAPKRQDRTWELHMCRPHRVTAANHIRRDVQIRNASQVDPGSFVPITGNEC
ncbi:hypothetical protein P171DRAFT_286686 [Karstenula rhodostoma CBS 690.94]|uniref:Uncharacterized protein n=1 Tax=Karstenula rhodostoma CBS 690.94 TaxID=1392251 RepID=A0A9P4PIU0_9PLEO|nr:hypothetical protein P171DRAFT_286686 [Karstenula rhodostoma CBS 690.94]